jgi:Ser/Thr protein kinase RdoA (MazF antagonist)
MNEQEVTQLLLEINTIHQQTFRFTETLVGGHQDRAVALVNDVHQRFILKRWYRDQAIPLLRTLVKRGYPSAPPLFAGTTKTGHTYWIQTYIEGQPMKHLDNVFLEQIFSINELQANCIQETSHIIQKSWSTYAYQVLFHNASDWFSHIQSYNQATRDFAETVRVNTQRCREMSLIHTDAVHGDFNPDNILVHNSKITGVIDIAAMGYGTRAIDIATLLHYSYLYEYEDSVKSRLRRYLVNSFDRETVLLTVAYRIFAMLAWAIEHDPQETVYAYVEKSRSLLQTI